MKAKSRATLLRYTAVPDPETIRNMFANIAPRYDRANTVMSGGIHHLWRRRAVRRARVRRGDAVLDCATGTGDLAIAFQRAVGPAGRVVGTDFTPEMIALARAKSRQVTFEVADVMQLPYDDGAFDVASIAFGIRNVGDPVRGIAEMARVVRSGGRVVIVETGQPRNRLLRWGYEKYCRFAFPRVGAVVAGDRAAYEYLESSAARFPYAEELADMMRRAADFASIDYEPLTFGVAWLYVATKR
jgi:demethylmenaquinone methyltransferase/2-methoxy-6-polyprenyl-1,4-benzoquinol methylase